MCLLPSGILGCAFVDKGWSGVPRHVVILGVILWIWKLLVVLGSLFGRVAGCQIVLGIETVVLVVRVLDAESVVVACKRFVVEARVVVVGVRCC